MLVLTRTEKQKLIIGDGEIIISILEVKGGKVRIGIEADKNIPIHREEVFSKLDSPAQSDQDKEILNSN